MARDVAAEIEALERFSRTQLRERWESIYGRPAPKKASRDLLFRAAAYRVQEEAEGGLSKAALRALAALAKQHASPGRKRTLAPQLKPGTRLLRDWGGEAHSVTVLENGFSYRNTRYRSLSQVAEKITGAHWSGPVFFGLRAPNRARADDAS